MLIRKKLVYAVISCLLICMADNVAIAQNAVVNGKLDLRYSGLREIKIIDLDGEWEFYWDKHLLPSHFADSITDYPDSYAEVPSYWSDYKKDIPDISRLGIGTYRMVILLPENLRHDIAFKIPVFDSSFKLYIDGKEMGSNGVAGKKASDSKPAYEPFTCQVKPQSDRLEIIINVSNFHHRRGGFWRSMKIGTPDALQQWIRTKGILDNVSFGILFAVSCFFLIFFIITRGNKTMIFFSIAIMGIILRGISTETYILSFLWDTKWIWLIRSEYLGSFIALIFGSWYFHSLFPDKFFKIINTLITVIFSLASLIVLVSPVLIFSNTVILLYPVIVLLIIYYALRSIISIFKGSIPGISTSIGFLAILFGIANDISLSASNILFSSYYILPYAITVFILSQVIILINTWVHSFNEEKRLANELEFINQNLEKIIIDRTSTLSRQNSEIENQKNAIEGKNQELEKTISVMNRVFSIIAHDLKSPVHNLSAMIDLLKGNRNRDDFDELTDDIRSQTGFTMNLIDNLLAWGQSQKSKIHYNPDKHNLTDIILECFSLLKEVADRKGIVMAYSHKGNPIAWCDKDLLLIIIRNILTNAIKFTGKNGKVSVLVEESLIHSGLLNIKITDNGIGISAEKIEKIKLGEFIDSTTGTEGEKGSGLGLQLCYDLVDLNKGRMIIESTEGKGTQATISIPTKS